jgi:Phospholipase_D-nuclease N-terminal
VYWGLAAIYVVLSVVFIADVLRQPSTALSGAGKALWIVALLVAPVFAWLVYGIWRIRQGRGL